MDKDAWPGNKKDSWILEALYPRIIRLFFRYKLAVVRWKVCPKRMLKYDKHD